MNPILKMRYDATTQVARFHASEGMGGSILAPGLMHGGRFLIWYALLLALALSAFGQVSPTVSTPVDASASQAEAVAKYPELGKAGSPFNKAFVARVAEWKTQFPNLFSFKGWPMLLANSVADDQVKDVASLLKVENTPDPQAGAAAGASGRRIFVLNSTVARVLHAELRVSYDDGTSESLKQTFTPRFQHEFSYHTKKKTVTKLDVLSVRAGELMPP